MNSALPAYSTGTPRHVHCPECDLWINVVARAMLDLAATGENAEKVQREAHAWIFSPLHDENFRTTCQYAGLAPEWVRRLAKTAPERFVAMISKENNDDAS